MNATYHRLNADICKLIAKSGTNVEVCDAPACPGMVFIRYQGSDGHTRATEPMQEKSAHFWLKGFKAHLMASVILLATFTNVYAQERPILASVITADYATTIVALHYPGIRESNPLLAWAQDEPVKMVLVAAALDAAGYLAWTRLTRNHKKVQRIGLLAAAGYRGYLTVKNLRNVRASRRQTHY